MPQILLSSIAIQQVIAVSPLYHRIKWDLLLNLNMHHLGRISNLELNLNGSYIILVLVSAALLQVIAPGLHHISLIV